MRCWSKAIPTWGPFHAYDKDLQDGYEAISRDFPLPEYVTTICHGKMKPEDKEESMRQFKSGEADIMVATSGIEVGVDFPNATVMGS